MGWIFVQTLPWHKAGSDLRLWWPRGNKNVGAPVSNHKFSLQQFFFVVVVLVSYNNKNTN
jgi:hypothetical protein